MKKLIKIICLLQLIVLISSLNSEAQNSINESKKLDIILDSDANNELDDQQALAYLFFNSAFFNTKAVTVNATYNGGNINDQYIEAERIMKLCSVSKTIPLFKGANTSFSEIAKDLSTEKFDGYSAVNFIIAEAKKHTKNKLVVIAVGKLTNIALALKKEPAISKNIRLVWLGGNYPDPGEYNLENDIPAMNFILKTDIDFEMVTVENGKNSGTNIVSVTKEEALKNLQEVGPIIEKPIIGRHGGEFYRFGDYSISLFEHVDYYGTPPSRALFDMAAVAIVKNPKWARSTEISCPLMIDKKWVDQPNNSRKIIIWEYFEKEKIINDFFQSLHNFK